GGSSTNCSTVGCGTVFRISQSGTLTSLHSFIGGFGGDGMFLQDRLVEGSDGNFYGTTSSGGSGFGGTVFRIGTDGGLTTLHAFGGADGDSPESGLVLGSDGNFYGTTSTSGAHMNGTVFRMSIDGELTTLHSFVGGLNEGGLPWGDLVEGSDGNFYGTTVYGGTNVAGGFNGGTVFRISPNGDFATLHVFKGSPGDGANPYAGLVEGSDGNFYGTTSRGGTSANCVGGCGTVFQIAPSGNLTILYSFSRNDGSDSRAALVVGSDGKLYGTTENTAFKLDAGLSGGGSAVLCSLLPLLATNSVGTAHTVVATVTSNAVASSGALVNFSVTAGPNLGQHGTATTGASGQGSFTYTGSVTSGTDTIRAVSLGATGTASAVWIAAAPAPHDLAIVTLKVPKKIALTPAKVSALGKFTVSIQNLGTANEVIPDFATLATLVTVNIDSLGSCPAVFAGVMPPKPFPITLKPKQKLNLAFTASFDCANDPLATSKTAGHNDFQVTATVDVTALGETDIQTSNDTCPRPANPAIGDKGCGTLGTPTFVDVVVKP
ncbi:MAG TPA: choice-of-anchor tandem repeat GloVer-containing protein, partial [Verrucomicrobiae bacterium]|nr:choice-of-anchor tandem repeat GloVer-containing protein [Verrucomicrobiae bacterium]